MNEKSGCFGLWIKVSESMNSLDFTRRPCYETLTLSRYRRLNPWREWRGVLFSCHSVPLTGWYLILLFCDPDVSPASKVLSLNLRCVLRQGLPRGSSCLIRGAPRLERGLIWGSLARCPVSLRDHSFYWSFRGLCILIDKFSLKKKICCSRNILHQSLGSPRLLAFSWNHAAFRSFGIRLMQHMI